MKNAARILAAVLALGIGGAGYVASAQAMEMKKDDKMMMHKGKMGKKMKKMKKMDKMDHMKKK